MANETANLSRTDAKQIVLAFIDAMNAFDYTKARSYVTDDLSFAGVLGSHNGADTYFGDMDKMRLRYTVIKAAAEGNDVCLTYDIMMGGKKIFCMGWYELREGKIHSIRVVFDPRPLLEN